MLERINGPQDIKELNREELEILASEIRRFLIEKISATGGHLASNLGVVELTMAMYLTFDLPRSFGTWAIRLTPTKYSAGGKTILTICASTGA